MRLPVAVQDDLIQRLGGPKGVAEMTGRKHRMEQQRDGKWRYVARNSSAGCSLDAVRKQGDA